eukprot:NODE_6457_length_638_cov_1.260274_g6434_i0.p2 GENE.NODE_6457_length_638_cov_1.260274_g6434_i0~~NODE_6457_length_638_cov_1.260274_g6434_i0.p2  ORF type:complete len:127 (-),score=15.61 NODE_6457_length_638_cov_1.260274_g6434_i0:86-466(-)
MCNAKRKPDNTEQGRNAKRNLKAGGSQNQMRGKALIRCQVPFARTPPEDHNHDKGQFRQPAMIPLHGHMVFERGQPDRIKHIKPVGDQLAIHQREGVKGISGIKPGNKAAGKGGKDNKPQKLPAAL